MGYGKDEKEGERGASTKITKRGAVKGPGLAKRPYHRKKPRRRCFRW